MARLRIIVLDRDNDNTYNFLMWADVPAARQSHYANASAVSAWSGAQAADNTALQNGSVVELKTSQRIPTGASLAAIQAFLAAKWTDYQAQINSYNPWQRYGTTWDGTTWTMTNNG